MLIAEFQCYKSARKLEYYDGYEQIHWWNREWDSKKTRIWLEKHWFGN